MLYYNEVVGFIYPMNKEEENSNSLFYGGSEKDVEIHRLWSSSIIQIGDNWWIMEDDDTVFSNGSSTISNVPITKYDIQ
jgi:hypothetical protein